MNCPSYCSTDIVKKGSLGNGKPKFKCNTCGRQLVEDPKKQPIPDSTKELIDKLNRTLQLHPETMHLSGDQKSVSFSKKIENHVGAIWYFIYYYNATVNA